MSDYITVPLSKRSKKIAGKYNTIVDSIDSDLANISWCAYPKRYTVYAVRPTYNKGERTTIRLHRVIMERMLNRKLNTKEQVDHIDGNGLNNSRGNLRLANNKTNSQNRLNRSNKTGFKGVSKQGDKYVATIAPNGKTIYLGIFKTPEQAHKAYCDAADKYFGEFANTGKTPD